MPVENNTLAYIRSANAIPFYGFALGMGEPEIIAMQLGLVAAHVLDHVSYEEMQDAIRRMPGIPRANLMQALTGLMAGDSYACMMNEEFGLLLPEYTRVTAQAPSSRLRALLASGGRR